MRTRHKFQRSFRWLSTRWKHEDCPALVAEQRQEPNAGSGQKAEGRTRPTQFTVSGGINLPRRFFADGFVIDQFQNRKKNFDSGASPVKRSFTVTLGTLLLGESRTGLAGALFAGGDFIGRGYIAYWGVEE